MTIAVCLKCGAMKIGAWTPCPKCRHLPQEPEDQAKHMMTTDHFFDKEALEGISLRVQNGQPLHFNDKNVADIAADLKTSGSSNKGCGLILFAILAVIVVLVFGVAYAIALLTSR
jgi:hypothetical protein